MHESSVIELVIPYKDEPLLRLFVVGLRTRFITMPYNEDSNGILRFDEPLRVAAYNSLDCSNISRTRIRTAGFANQLQLTRFPSALNNPSPYFDRRERSAGGATMCLKSIGRGNDH